MTKYLTSPSPEFDTVFESLSEIAQSGVSASGMTLSRYFMMYMDDATVTPGESFVSWMDGHFRPVHEQPGLFDNTDPVRDIYALDGSPGAEGIISEEALRSLGKVAVKVPI